MENGAPRRLHNPNHPPPRQPDPYPQYLPAAQPPIQQPSYDPFPRRDPFLPAPHSERRDSSQPQPQPPPPPPPGPGFWSSERPREADQHASLPPPPPPPSYMSRSMPPPMASPQQSPGMHPPPISRSALPTPPAPNGTTPRDSSSSKNMSISSIMSPDTSVNHRPSSSFSSSSRQLTYDQHNGRPATPPERRVDTHVSTLQSPRMYASPTDTNSHPLSHLNRPLPPPTNGSSLPPRPYSQPAGLDGAEHDPYRPDNPFGPRRTASDENQRDRALSDVAGNRSLHRLPPLSSANGPPPHGPQPWPHEQPYHPEAAHSYPPPPAPYPAPPQQSRPYGAAPVYGASPSAQAALPLDPRSQYPPPASEMTTAANAALDDLRNRRVSLDAPLRRSIEEGQMAHKHVLGLGQDSGRRLDRSSPLPQAVQGVSAQPAGSGRAPSIKSEFGRLFSGLGSGVGSTPQPVTYPHQRPSRSPVQHDDGEADVDLRRAAAGRGINQRKRTYDNSSEDGDGRSSPIGGYGGRGGSSKKSRQSYATPHHHHHAHHHHHHYYRQREEEAMAMRRTSGTPVSGYRYGSVPTHHHHHHHAPHHHHHHPPTQAAAPAPPQQIQPMRLPSTTIKTKPLLQSLQDLPRRHLGSQLYAPKVTMATQSTPYESKYQYGTEPNSLPLFDGKENCTFTVRVPRFYLSHDGREHVCLQRRVWGTDVYTDDSDPLTAAIHSGWIKGAWSEEIDEDIMLGRNPDEKEKPAEIEGEEDVQPVEKKKPAVTSTATLTEPPEAGPVEPPPDRDAHITILVLPALEKYTATTWHGIRSRQWGSNHDGLSFKIEKIEWVDELAEVRYEERGPEARRKRLDRHMFFERRTDSDDHPDKRLSLAHAAGSSLTLGQLVGLKSLVTATVY